MATKKRTQEIHSLFDRYLKTGDKLLIDGLMLEELEMANADLGERDLYAPYRIAIKNRIEELKQKTNTERYWITIIVSVFIAIIGWLFFSN